MVESSSPLRVSVIAVWRWPWWVWTPLAVLALLFYPLSFGPVVWLVDRYHVEGLGLVVIDLVYLPLMIAQELCPPLDAFLASYIEWWRPVPSSGSR